MTMEGHSVAVTADDVARAAGVSRWTVSRAFKSGAPISDKARKKVLEAAERLGYAPDLLAAGLASERSNLVALLIDDFANPHKLVILERLTRILRENGFGTLLVNTLNRDGAPAALLDASQRRVDAAVLIGVECDDQLLETALGARRIRKLIVFARASDRPDTISICCDDVAATQEIADHLIERGYKRPLFLAGPTTVSAHLTRKETFVKYWQAACQVTPDVLSVSAYDPRLARDKVSDHFAARDRAGYPDVIVCENDALAIGVVDAVRHDLGMKVPDDIAVTGFDDIPLASNPNYSLTTYHQPIAAMAEGLVEVLNGTWGPARQRGYIGQFVVRTSA